MVLVFFVLNVAINLALPRWSFDVDFAETVGLLFPLISYVVAGIVTGISARRSPIMHGLLLGLIIMVLFAAMTVALADLSGLAFVRHALGAMVVCCLGAIFGDYLARRGSAP
jgi:putative membrane protein (TIGR04086 family)